MSSTKSKGHNNLWYIFFKSLDGLDMASVIPLAWISTRSEEIEIYTVREYYFIVLIVAEGKIGLQEIVVLSCIKLQIDCHISISFQISKRFEILCQRNVFKEWNPCFQFAWSWNIPDSCSLENIQHPFFEEKITEEDQQVLRQYRSYIHSTTGNGVLMESSYR